MGKINIPTAETEFEIADYVEGGSGTLVMKSPTPLILAKADNHGSKLAMELGIGDDADDRISRLITTEIMIFTLENILYDKSDGSLVSRELLEQFPDTLFNDIVESMYGAYDLPLTDSPGDTITNG